MPTANTQDLLKEIKPYVLGWTTSQYSSLLALNKFQQLPMLRGLWFMNSINENGSVYDASGQGRTLTNNNAAQFLQLPVTFQNYVALDGSSQYLSRAYEAGLGITGPLTVVCWLKSINLASSPYVASRWSASNYVWRITISTSGRMQAGITGDGSTIVQAQTDIGSVTSGTWCFGALRYTPSTELAIWCNNSKAVYTTGIPASLYASTSAPLTIGSTGVPSSYLNGGVALVAVCAGLVSDEQIQYLYEG